MSNLRESQLCYPKVETWFMCWDNERVSIRTYGSILPTQCMETYWNEVDYYLSEEEWLAILLENGINPDGE